ncbi:squalene monooxygenase [Patella vulgata]|uniref:squalene monooxygenase n=1 Tax=Patella vulgata TaxID=6465 RepID=UPI00217F65AC|nr:squalene monooxygenase [Patella vulgata]XP_050401171.1 squalene monooxygenase [Patella vulgata]XP_050401172.1 squalene monooxygenase [Patella vulgata]XP_055956602.1 squalene monooxygenase [Patella vulgata]
MLFNSLVRLGGDYVSFDGLPSIVMLSVGFIVVALSCLFFYIRNIKKIISVIRPEHSFTDKSEAPEIIIIGSGVLGSSIATVLAKDGRRVTVIERDMKQPDRIVGELLQPGGVKALIKLGLGECLEGLDSHPIKGYVIHDLETEAKVTVPYPKDQDTDEIIQGRAFHHGRFIMALRKKAQEQENVTYIEATASKLIEDKGVIVGVQYREKMSESAKEIYAPLTIVVDGCFSKFRKQLVKEKVEIYSHFVGTLMVDCPQTLLNHAELILAKPSPVLIYQISSKDTRVLVDVRGTVEGNMREYMLHQIAPQLPDHIKEPFIDGVIDGRLRTMPNSFLPPSPIEKPGVLVIGDALNMRHPLTGGGMSVALNDAVMWRNLLKSIPDLTNYEALIKASRVFQLRRKHNHSFVVNVLAQALYELFAASDVHLHNLKRACFEYFKLGGECVSGPVGLLSVMTPKPHLLIGHFFAVALYAVLSVFRSEPIWALHRVVYRSFMIFYKACGVIFPLMWSELKGLI